MISSNVSLQPAQYASVCATVQVCLYHAIIFVDFISSFYCIVFILYKYRHWKLKIFLRREYEEYEIFRYGEMRIKCVASITEEPINVSTMIASETAAPTVAKKMLLTEFSGIYWRPNFVVILGHFELRWMIFVTLGLLSNFGPLWAFRPFGPLWAFVDCLGPFGPRWVLFDNFWPIICGILFFSPKKPKRWSAKKVQKAQLAKKMSKMVQNGKMLFICIKRTT